MRIVSLSIFNNKDTGTVAVDYCGETHIVYCKIKRLTTNSNTTILKLKGRFPNGRTLLQTQSREVKTSITIR